MEWIAHLTYLRGRLSFSGYGASGDPARHKIAHRIDVGSEFRVSEEQKYGVLIVSRVCLTEGFTPASLLVAARSGLFGFRILDKEDSNG